MNEVSTNINNDLPLYVQYVKNWPMDKPWKTPAIKDARRQRAWINGNFTSYTFYRKKE
jgi:hypothetical protein